MAKKTGAIRVNVTVPSDLKRRMEQVGAEVNWSAVATEAFTVKLGHIAQEKAKKEMSDVVDRLRASKLQGAAEAYVDGHALGDQWAKETASAEELERLEKSADEKDSWDVLFGLSPDKYMHLGLAGSISEVITGQYDREVNDDFWDMAVGEEKMERLEDADFLRGFCDGALSFWESVSPEVSQG